MKINWTILNQYLADGKIIANKHPTKDLWILNYTRVTQFEKLWDEITLACRGLVVDKEGNIVARPLPKFFNDFEYSEGKIPYGEAYEVFIKYDGSLGIVFSFEGEVIMASRGSFVSEQAIKGFEIFKRGFMAESYIAEGWTYVFEIIYPSNRIVVDYGNEEKVVLLSVMNNETGKEAEYDEMYWLYNDRYNVAERVNLDVPVTELRSTIQGSDEGYIVKFESGFRMKIKGEEYCRLHRILTNVSNKSIWESLKFEKPLEEILERIPDEYDEWVNREIKYFNDCFAMETMVYRKLADHFKKIESPKDRAFAVMEYCKARDKNWGIIFSMISETDKWKKIIWDSLRPVFEKPAKNIAEFRAGQ